MAEKNERFEGVDSEFLARDTWTEQCSPLTCPQCGLEVDETTVRCPRCNALLLMACSGVCGACLSRTCVRRQSG